jgi:VWFA-related protein
VVAWVAGLVLALHAPAGSRTPQESQPSFKATSELVVLHVSVEDSHGRPVPGLTRDAFSVYEDHAPQPIEMFSSEDVPASIGLLIDNSASMWPHRDLMVASVLAFAGMSHPEDEIFVLAFNEEVRTAWPPTVIADGDRAAFRAALTENITARGMTALYDSIVDGIGRVTSGRHTRQVILIVSDGGDNASQASIEHALKLAHESDAAVYTVSLVDSQSGDADPKFLRKLAHSSGGESFMPRRPSEVSKAFEEIARDIRSSYTIAYVPPHPLESGMRRTVRVVAKSPTGKPLIVRTRDGYFTKP